jgi:hypothetical protein
VTKDLMIGAIYLSGKNREGGKGKKGEEKKK